MTVTTFSIIKKLLVFILIFTVLHFAKEFLIPLAIGGLLATLFYPLCLWMEKKKIPRIVATSLCLLALLLTITGIFILIGWQISELTKDIELIKQKIVDTTARIQQYVFDNLDISAEKQVEIFYEQRPSVSGIIANITGSISSIFTGFILILAYVFLLLYYRNHIKQFFLKLSPPEQKQEMAQVVYGTTLVSQQYLVGLTKMIICLWIMYSIGFTIVGVKNPLFFAFICGLLEIVPFIGNITGTTLTVLVSAVHGASIGMLGGIVITYATVQFIQGWVLEPIIVGPQVKINPFATIVALVIGSLVWGIAGIFLAIPLIAMIKIVCDNIDSFKPFGFLIGEIGTKKSEPGFVKKLKKLV
jgi:predicted PurR-regulated permease PerM